MTYTNVTLEVDPVQAQQMIYIQIALDGIYLSLRNNDDNGKIEDLPNVKMADILGPGGQIEITKPAALPPSQLSGEPNRSTAQQNPGSQLMPQVGVRK
jgi:hypothetical protein